MQGLSFYPKSWMQFNVLYFHKMYYNFITSLSSFESSILSSTPLINSINVELTNLAVCLIPDYPKNIKQISNYSTKIKKMYMVVN